MTLSGRSTPPTSPIPAPGGRLRSGAVLNLGIIVIGLVGIAGLLLTNLATGEDAPSAESVDLPLRFDPVVEGLAAPVLLIGSGGDSGDRYIVEQAGRILRLSPDGSIDAQPFLDISDHVKHQGEQGLLGLAFHPDFARNGRFFVDYTRRDDGATTISEFTIAVDAADAGPVESTERTLLTIAQPYANHNGGMIAFDGEGMLIISTGDGGSGGDPLGNGQDRASLLGKLLRLDVDRGWPYATPRDNGFADDPEAKPEIHAIGLRNAWRFSVDRASGVLYIGDVGQGDWEEIDVLPPGTSSPSFGWNQMEGRECFGDSPCDPAAHILPAVAYPHSDGDRSHCSVIGGYAYRGAAGSLADGTYLYADYCSGTIWAVPTEQLLAGDAQPAIVGQVPSGTGQALSFGEDDDGELYLLTNGGHVLRISAADLG